VSECEPLPRLALFARAFIGKALSFSITSNQRLTLVPISAQLELTVHLPAQLKLNFIQSNPWMCPEGAQVEL
jgi:hypothetical protein